MTRRFLSRLTSHCTGHRMVPVIMTMMVLGMNAAALAGPPNPALRRTHPAWIGYVVMFLLLVIVMLVSLMPSKRSHQD